MNEELLQEYLKDQTKIVNIIQNYQESEVNNELVFALLQNINDVDASIQEQYILPFILQVFISNQTTGDVKDDISVGSKLFYELALIMSDFYDESPQFVAAFQISMTPLFGLQYNLFRYPSMLYLFYKNKRCDIQQCITKIYTMLSQLDQQQLIQLINGNPDTKYAVQAIFMIICACETDVYQNNQTQLNQITQFFLSGILQLNNLYVNILETITDQFNEGNEGVFIIFNQLPYIYTQLGNLNTPLQENIILQYQTMYVGLLSLLGVEQNGFLTENAIVDSNAVITYVRNILINYSINLNNNNHILLLNQIFKLLRNCAMHSGFKVQQSYLDLYQMCWTLSAAILNLRPQEQKIQIQLLQETIVSFIITFIYNQQASNIISSQFVVQFNEGILQVQTNVNQQPTENQNVLKQIAMAFSSILQTSLQLNWVDANNFDIFKQYMRDMYEQNLLDTLNQQLVLQVINFIKLIDSDDSSELSDF